MIIQKLLICMMAMFSKFLNKASLWLALFCFLFAVGQEMKPNDSLSLPAQLFNKYHKWGPVIGASVLFVTNEENAVRYTYKKPIAFEIGATYNFLQYKKFNFNIGFIYRIHNLKNFEYFTEEDASMAQAGSLIVGPYKEYKIPLQGEYFFPIYNKFSGFIGIGPELIFNRKVEGSGSSFIIQPDGTEIGYIDKEDYNKNLFIGGNITFGVNIKTNILLLRPYVTYHYQPDTLYTNVVTTQNLMVSKNTVSKHSITGNYIMFGVSILPGKNLF